MKKTLYLLLFATISIAYCSAQELRTAYFMQNSTIRTAMNPALRPNRGFVSIPAIGNLSISLNSNGASLNTFLYPKNGELVTFLDPTVNGDKFLQQLGNINQVNMDFSSSIISFAWYHGEAFWSIDVNIKSTQSVAVPKGLFEFIKNGNGTAGKKYDLSSLSMHSNSYTELALGYSKPINDRLVLGGKLKILLGISNLSMEFDQLDATLNELEWSVKSSGRIDASMHGLSPKFDLDDQGDPYLSGGELNGVGIAGQGTAIDLGASYQILDNFKVSGAIIDLGFIQWSAKNSISGIASDSVLFDGFTFNVEGDNNVGDQLDSLKSDFKNMTRFRQISSSNRSTLITATLNLGAEYALWDNRFSFGLLSSTKFYNPEPFTEITASVNFRPNNWFATSLSYSALHSDFKTLGLAINFSPSWINFFIGTDYMLTKVSPQYVPIEVGSTNIYLGLSVPIGKKSGYKASSLPLDE